MIPKLFELRPERNLLNSEFAGYKLSLESIAIIKTELEIQVDRVLPDSNQYSLLHVKLFGLHNHLFSDKYSDNVYYVDKQWNVQKVSINSLTGLMNPIDQVWQIPKKNERKSGHYNISIHFSSKSVAVVSDGTGYLYIVNTGDRNENVKWQFVFADEVLDADKGFIIHDSVLKEPETNQKELHCLLLNIDRNEDSEGFATVVSWVTFTETDDNNWGAISLRVLKATGNLYYCALEHNCKYIYIASDNPFKFLLDSENPIIEKQSELKSEIPKIYTWLQTDDDITIRFNVGSRCDKEDILVDVKRTGIIVKHKNTFLLQGNFAHQIDSELSTWDILNDMLEVILIKSESGLMWSDFISGDQTGEQVIDPSLVAQVHSRLAHLCSDTEVIPSESGPSFSTQQIEECDFVGDNTAIFQRFCSNSHEVTHHVNLGSHQVILTVQLNVDTPPSLAVRHDVDACLWTPQLQNDNWCLKHDGTLLAFGYVQASKQQRKFSSCSPDLSYSVICESARHVFIYRQNKSVLSGELRNRRSGQKVPTVAQQQVVSLSDDEILGLCATNEILYLLTEDELLALKIV